ncbi:YcjF family protein [Roseicitreum antarcticum]|uniref:Putative membrane protein n=1 Tax=Roseicitreum antarcticum TaxID=564137 RepID=A0A1H2XF93_9RHOB|nr:TIGR01620 family protein [Roseicitreum antarcticum]SDW91505.1 putative membrane protein [Roseicitreum antarcticum]
MTRKPMLFDVEGPAAQTPVTAPPLHDPEDATAPDGRAMRAAARIGAGRWSWFGRLTAWAFGLFTSLVVTVWLWDFVTGLLARNAALGTAALVLAGALGLALLAWLLREALAWRRLRNLDALRRAADSALALGDAEGARRVALRIARLYHRGDDRAFAARVAEVLDADAVLGLAETDLLRPVDQQARAAIERATRQVAAVTALVPLTLADVVVALVANLTMIRNIAALYGGRAGILGSLRLLRGVFGHLLATGALSVGDDLISSVAGGGLLSKVSRRFGEGVVNGALTARVGLAAMDVCRPLQFQMIARPKLHDILRRSLTGLFDARA